MRLGSTLQRPDISGNKPRLRLLSGEENTREDAGDKRQMFLSNYADRLSVGEKERVKMLAGYQFFCFVQYCLQLRRER